MRALNISDLTSPFYFRLLVENKEMVFKKWFKKGMGNLKYLKPSDEGILQFLSNSIEIWSRDQFFHENQLSYIARVKFLLI